MAEDGEDVLLWNKDGFVTETSIANIIVSIDGESCTPPVECGLLAGTYREWLLRKGEIRERKIHVSELTPATDLTLMNSVRGQYSAELCSTTIEDYYSNRYKPIDRSRIAP